MDTIIQYPAVLRRPRIISSTVRLTSLYFHLWEGEGQGHMSGYVCMMQCSQKVQRDFGDKIDPLDCGRKASG